MTSGPPPDEPELRSDPWLLSPASPKPIHFPKPTNIPILDLQTDVDFNQMELHMADPAMHNTELRPGAWQDPNEQKESEAEPPPAAANETGGSQSNGDVAAQDGDTTRAEDVSASIETAHNAPAPESLQLSDHSSENKAAFAATEAQPASATGAQPLPSIPNVTTADSALQSNSSVGHSDEVTLDQTPNASAAPGSVDVQSLLKSLQTAPNAGAPSGASLAPPADALTSATTLSPSYPAQPPAPGVESSPLSASGLGAPPAGLPARPPPQEQPLIHPNYVHSQHIRDYHPHATNPAFQPHGRSDSTGGSVADASSRGYPATAPSPSQSNANTSAIPYQQPTPNSATLPVQSPAQFQYPSYPTQSNQPTTESRRESYVASNAPTNSSDAPWSADIQRKYDDFIALERQYVQEGRWDQFPNGSRLFVGTRDLHGRKTTYEEDRLNALAGNLSSEKVTKRDIFHVFHVYGRLAQISIKQAYGFVQFFSAEDCRRALEGEQGRVVRDKRIHLEVSKPQKNRQPTTRRSRSPDYGRSNPPPTTDRYVSGSRNGGRGSRDGYRPGYRSPSPRGYRDRYDDRYRTRSPPSYGGRRPRSPSPRRGEPDDDLPLPKRAPKDVPDVQIVVLDSLDRDFIAWVEGAFTSRGIRVDVLLLSPRLDEQAVIRRQIVEGVLAVSRLTRNNQNTSKIDIQLFDRRGGQNNVKFEEYQSLDPPVAAELVVRAKSTHAAPTSYGGYSGPPPTQHGYGYGDQPAPSYRQPPSAFPSYQQQSPAPAGAPPNLQSLITNLDPAGLQSLLSAMNSQQGTPATPQQPPPSIGYSAPPGQFGQQQQQQQDALAVLRNNPALAGLLQQQAQQQIQPQQGPTPAGGGQVNMQDILARLGKGGR